MKLFKRSYLSMTLAAALAGGGAPQYVGAVTLSQDNIGDVGIGPYYTMRDGWATDFYIINTSGSTTVAKVRFHEARNSREVLDFVVVLSPYDMINGWAYLSPDGPVVKFPALNGESSCVVPVPAGGVAGGTLPFSDVEYTGAKYDGWPSSENPADYGPLGTIDRALEGYFTVIEEGTAESGAVAAAAMHPGPDCEAVAEAFRPENIVDTYKQFGRNLNNLKVGFSFTNATRGVQGAGSATMLANFATNRSAIAHTITSLQSGGAAVEVAQANATTAAGNLTAAQTGVIGAKADLCNSSCGGDFDALIAPAQSCTSTPPGLSNDADPSAQDVENLNTCPSTLVDAYDAALGTLATATTADDAAQQALGAAIAGQLGAPLNLIHAQSGKTQFGDPERFPSLNSGDFFAYWFRDGQYRNDGNYNKLPDSINLPFGLWAGLYMRPVDAVTALLMKSDLINEWAYNANTGASSDLIATAPTKRWYTDWVNVYEDGGHLNGISPYLAQSVILSNAGWPPFGSQFRVSGRSCDEVWVGIWNNDEIGPKDPILPSPSPDVSLCWESNVLYTGPQSLFGSKVGTHFSVRDLFNVPVEQTYNGWINVNMTANTYNYHPALPLLNLTLPNIPEFWPVDEIVQLGMPYIGFAFKQRDLGNPALAYGGVTPHSYMRDWDKRNAFGGTLTLDWWDTYGPYIIPSVLSWFGTNPIFPINNQQP